NPTQTVERLWEAVDLIVKAWTTHDGPFNFEGRFTHRRAVNVWPRPYQSPHPPIWITGSSDFEAIRKLTVGGYPFAPFLRPHERGRKMSEVSGSAYRVGGLRGGGGWAYMPLVYTADSEAEGERGARELSWYINVKVKPQYRNPPGYVPVALNVKALQGAYAGRTAAIRAQGLEFQKEQGVVVYG